MGESEKEIRRLLTLLHGRVNSLNRGDSTLSALPDTCFPIMSCRAPRGLIGVRTRVRTCVRVNAHATLCDGQMGASSCVPQGCVRQTGEQAGAERGLVCACVCVCTHCEGQWVSVYFGVFRQQGVVRGLLTSGLRRILNFVVHSRLNSLRPGSISVWDFGNNF